MVSATDLCRAEREQAKAAYMDPITSSSRVAKQATSALRLRTIGRGTDSARETARSPRRRKHCRRDRRRMHVRRRLPDDAPAKRVHHCVERYGDPFQLGITECHWAEQM